jgi:hypothetical protein
MTDYKDELVRLRGQVNDDSILQQVAWLTANAKRPFNERRGAPRNACAWDNTYYYYISYIDPTAIATPGAKPPYRLVKIPIDRIPLLLSPLNGDFAWPMASKQDQFKLPPFAKEVVF